MKFDGVDVQVRYRTLQLEIIINEIDSKFSQLTLFQKGLFAQKQ